MNRRGFTIIELIIVITLMGILLTLGVTNLQSSQANARDAQRGTDISNIALNLEQYYNSGNNSSTTIGSYPPTTVLIGHETTVLPNLDAQDLIPPGKTTSGLIAATTTSTIQYPTPSQYIYQPLSQDGTLCTASTSACQKFNLYYQTEVDGVIHMVTSKNQ